MIEYKYNEKKYAELIISKGFQSKYHSYELKILVKYFKYLGYKPQKRKELIYKFCKKYIENFKRVKYFKMINSALAYGAKKNNCLVVIEKIPITDKEIEYINNLDICYDYKKVVFTLLVQNKLIKELCRITFKNVSKYNFFGGKKEHYKETQDMANLSKKYNINNIIKCLNDMGIVEVRTRGRINLLFVSEIPESDNVAMCINTYDNIGYWFDWYNGDKKIIRCEGQGCGKLIRATSNRKKYCDRCWKDRERELWRLNKRKNKEIPSLENPKNTHE